MTKKRTTSNKTSSKTKATNKAIPKLGAHKQAEEPKAEEFTEIGGSPVPGITLRQVLRGHTNAITRIAWSPDGHYLASPSYDKTIRIWNVTSGQCVQTLKGHNGIINTVAWSPNGQILASSSA